jgi:hypothetical protein
MTSKENLNENLHKPISGIFAKKFMGPHCNALNTSVIYEQTHNQIFILKMDKIKCATKLFLNNV